MAAALGYAGTALRGDAETGNGDNNFSSLYAAARAGYIEEELAKNQKIKLGDGTFLYKIVISSNDAPKLGVTFNVQNKRICIIKILKDGMLDKLGINVGDVVTRINDFTITYDETKDLHVFTKNTILNYLTDIRKVANEDNPLMLYIRPIQQEQEEQQQHAEEKLPDGGSKSRKKSRYYKNTKRRRRKSRHNKKSKM